jgi:hypothetical protein
MTWHIPVNPSSFIAQVGFDHDTGTLGIKMQPKAGSDEPPREYLYPGAAADEYIKLMNAPSTGKAFAEFKRRYTPPPPADGQAPATSEAAI